MSSAILAKFVSLHDDTCKDFTMIQDDVVIGRKKGCTHCIPNTKISGEHCRVTLDREDGIFTITDYSTNGTFVNDKKIKKNEPTIISNEDRIYLLKDQEEGMKIGFIFVSVFKQKQLKNERKRMREEVEEEKEDNEDSSNKRFKIDEESIADQVKCSLCLEVMYKPISLQPCTHNFCGGCFSGWIKTHNDCPECKGKIKHIKQNRMLISMIHFE